METGVGVNEGAQDGNGDGSPIRRPRIKYSSPAHCAYVKRPTRVQLQVLQPTNARFTPGREKTFSKTRETAAKDTPLESIWCLLQVQRSPREPQQTLEWVRSNTLRYHTTAF